ncbi:uncharacterized protein LOC141687104 isoform X4 [Apium graveolens]|uniref:uncharacterized protein LOC141687104 isoform X4 n=1 Tax=Apium graveolens TaxID=4045 RepID=UPI003D7A0F51
MKQSVAKSLKSLIGIKSICSEVQMQDFLSYWSSFTSTLLQLFSMNFRTDSRADSDIEGLKRKLTNKLYVQCDGFVPDWKVTRLIPSLLSPSVAQVPQKTHLIGITFIQFK